jgi:hypothetical protein
MSDIVHEVTDRPVEDLSREQLYAEWSEAYEQLLGTIPDDRRDSLWDRRRDVWSEMRKRTEADPPTCPECGHDRWKQEFGGPKFCANCGIALGEEHRDLIEAIDAYWTAVQSTGGEA